MRKRTEVGYLSRMDRPVVTGTGLACDDSGWVRESVLFIGTQFSILYTSMYSPAEAATND
jgi:hypothetical protein